MKNSTKQALAIYGTNIIGPYLFRKVGTSLSKVSNSFNPTGAIIFGGINIAKKIHSAIDNRYVRIFESLGALYYSSSAICNLISGLSGNTKDFAGSILDASMAYQLLANQGVIDNITNKQTEKDINGIISDLERVVRR